MGEQIRIVPSNRLKGLPVVTDRPDAANHVWLHLGPGAEEMGIRVRPQDKDQLSFGLVVKRELANEVYEHPYPYMYAASLAVDHESELPKPLPS